MYYVITSRFSVKKKHIVKRDTAESKISIQIFGVFYFSIRIEYASGSELEETKNIRNDETWCFNMYMENDH